MLNLKGVDYDYVAISLLDKKQKSEDYLSNVNPNGLVPAFIHKGNTISESLAIMEYLEEAFPDKGNILPKDLIQRSKVRELSSRIASGIQPLQNLSVISHPTLLPTKMEWSKEWITKGFDSLEQRLAATAGKYCVGDEISMADCCLIPQIYNARRFDVDMSKYPIVLRIEQALKEVKAFQDAEPEKMPDAPKTQ